MNDLSTVVKTLEIEKDTLSRDLEYKKSEDFVEKMARTELTLVKPGEEIYVVEGDFTQNVSNSGVKAALGAFTERLSATNSPNHFNEWFSLFL